MILLLKMLRFIQGFKRKKGLDKKAFWSNWKKKIFILPVNFRILEFSKHKNDFLL